MVKIFTNTKISLIINKETRDRVLEQKIPDLLPLVRLFCRIKFAGAELSEIAMLDTGAHISLIPFYLWKKLDTQVVAEHVMKGAIPDKSIPVNVGYVKARIIDGEGNISKEIRFLSYLAFTNNVPLILGMRDLLEKFDIHILFSQNKAYLEET